MVLVCLIIGVSPPSKSMRRSWCGPRPSRSRTSTPLTFTSPGVIGGAILFQVVNFTLLVASIGSGGGGQLAGARLLYGMGRDNALPPRFFAYLDPKRRVPSLNVILIGVLCLVGAWLITYEIGAELLNFGALIGFMGVNVAAFLHYLCAANGSCRTSSFRWPGSWFASVCGSAFATPRNS
jgi:putrescine importer